MECRRPDSVLGDREAAKALQRIDYDFDRAAGSVAAISCRSLCAQRPTTVGPGTRVHRVDTPCTVRWYDIDLPDVIELRRRVFPPCAETIAASVNDPELLDGIAGDTPVLVIAEGLTPYLRAVDGLVLLRRITEHFESGEMLFDGYGRLGVWFLRRYGCVKPSGAQLGWAINDPRELERAVPGLILDAELWYTDAPGIEQHYSPLFRRFARAIYHVTPIRRLGRPLRYRFGHRK